MLCVLKGGHQFSTDLADALKKLRLRGCVNAPLTFDFIRVMSYTGTESTGDIQIETLGINLSALAGRHLLLVEGTIDTGHTMAKLIPHLQQFNPASVKVAALLQKRTPKSNGFIAEYVGFSIPHHFVVGYCLDYDQVCVCQLSSPLCALQPECLCLPVCYCGSLARHLGLLSVRRGAAQALLRPTCAARLNGTPAKIRHHAWLSDRAAPLCKSSYSAAAT